jgi:hypothetical protein
MEDLTTYSGGTFITIPNILPDGSGQRTQGFPQETPLDFYTGTQNGCPRWWYATTLGDLGDLLEGPTSSALWEPCFGDFGTTGQVSLSPTSYDAAAGVPINPDVIGYSFQII